MAERITRDQDDYDGKSVRATMRSLVKIILELTAGDPKPEAERLQSVSGEPEDQEKRYSQKEFEEGVKLGCERGKDLVITFIGSVECQNSILEYLESLGRSGGAKEGE